MEARNNGKLEALESVDERSAVACFYRGGGYGRANVSLSRIEEVWLEARDAIWNISIRGRLFPSGSSFGFIPTEWQ
jgi:hypothetical protein